MITISLCMIVKNEERVINRCLSTIASLVDEIIIVDTGSTDRTKSIVQTYTDSIYDFTWIDDFAAARNYAFSKATKEYILWLDADDVLLESDQHKLSELKESLPSDIDSVTMLYNLSSDEYGNVTFSLRRNRLVKRSKNFHWIGPVHEYLEVHGNITNSDVAVTHLSLDVDPDTGRNLRIYEKRELAGEEFTPRDLFYFANELKDHSQHEKAIRYYEKFLLTGKGWIEDILTACSRLADCYHVLGDDQAAFLASIRSLQFAAPRAEFCCRIGYRFLELGQYDNAIFWYKLATELELPVDYMGFHNPSFSTWLPNLQLAVCYDRIGAHALANSHNETALTYRPGDETMLANQSYFQAKLEELEEAETRRSLS
ncbi:glycosyltransferase [Paenibacillus sp. JCM 10914]|uniref:glycosyltransferase n=1 Tax=Paenibacillus sp. JCM 10914 TaxID=1236974 RepID=UPI0003CC8BF4|nr:glycosyltransferase [Paenibacillus sp. JCM 10914]GAE06954.1 glycosyl transferase, group 2 family protein [Paenibacillus sp. JCM 10914]